MRKRACLVCIVLLSASAFAAEPSAEDVAQRLEVLRHTWDDEELPVAALAIDPDREAAGSVSAGEAAEDVERLFTLLSHGYSGYAFFGGDGRFDPARVAILRDLGERSTWDVPALADLIHRHLSFVRDCHTRIGGRTYGDHRDYWYDETLEIREEGGDFRFDRDGERWTLTAISGGPPGDWLRPSLAADGRRVWRIGTLSKSRPAPVTVEASGAPRALRLEVELRRSDFAFWSRDLFREDRVGGVPVLRIRTFTERHEDAIGEFLETADRYRGSPCVVVDLRGNGGGSEKYVVEWIRRLTGRRAGSVFHTSEMRSRTALMGRANAMAYWYERSPGTDFYRQEAERFRAEAEGAGGPRWTGPFAPVTPRIPNETTVVIVTNGRVASAAEGFVMRARQAENVFVVGENTCGALTFGNVSAHRLPHSGMMVWVPINFGLFPDLEFREEEGLAPDFWVPAPQAVNRAVAALRAGTIPTVHPIPEDQLAEEFVPEDPDHMKTVRARRRAILLGLAALAGLALSFRQRRKPAALARLAIMSVVVGTIWIELRTGKELLEDGGAALRAFGAVALLCGVVLWVRRRRRAAEEAPPA